MDCVTASIVEPEGLESNQHFWNYEYQRPTHWTTFRIFHSERCRRAGIEPAFLPYARDSVLPIRPPSALRSEIGYASKSLLLFAPSSVSTFLRFCFRFLPPPAAFLGSRRSPRQVQHVR